MSTSKNSFVTAQNLYLAPGPREWLSGTLRNEAGVVGCLTLTSNKYIWNVDRTRGIVFNDQGQAWDVFNDQSVDQIVLWHRINGSVNQRFQIGINSIRFQDQYALQVAPNQCARLTHKDNDGTTFTIYDEEVELKQETNEHTNKKAKHQTKSVVPIHFVSYNTLVDHPAYEDDFKDAIASKYRSWHHSSGIRRNLVRKALLSTGLDLMTLVEVTPSILDFLFNGQQETTSRYTYVYCERADGMGSAIVFDKDRFTLVGNLCIPTLDQHVQMTNSALLLDHQQDDKPICVTALHLKAGYEDQEERRLVEIASAMRQTREWLDSSFDNANLDKMAHVVAGDLNSNRLAYPSRMYDYMTQQEHYTDVFQTYKHGKFFTYWFWEKAIFDYVFIHGPISATEQFIPASSSPSPNQEQGSDHLPIYCTLLLK